MYRRRLTMEDVGRSRLLLKLTWGLVFLATPETVVEGADEKKSATGVERWLGPQAWKRDTAAPTVVLGEPGAFDDTHIFAPSVALEEDEYRMWYCGSRGAVKERVFRLGLTVSHDGGRSRSTLARTQTKAPSILSVTTSIPS